MLVLAGEGRAVTYTLWPPDKKRKIAIKGGFSLTNQGNKQLDTMPVNFFSAVLAEGTAVIPHYDILKIAVPVAVGVGTLKYYFGGTANIWERKLHGKVILMTVSAE